MSEIVFGQYIKGKSWIYKLDSRFKIILLILLIISAFLFKSIYGMLGFVAFILLLILTSRLPLNKVLSTIKPMIFLLLFTFVIQSVSFKDDNPLYLNLSIGLYSILGVVGLTIITFLCRRYKIMKSVMLVIWLVGCVTILHFLNMGPVWTSFDVIYYKAGMIKGAFVFLRLLVIILMSSLLTFTTMPMDLNNALEYLLHPLKYLHVPVSEIAMMLSITLRFIPTLILETQKIMKSQAARGVSFDEGSIKQKMMQIVSLLIPLFSISLKKAEDLAYAMEARGYVLDAPRTRLDELKCHWYDFFALSIVLGIMIGVIVCKTI